ncbi:MAG: hypothetical protein DPW18_19450 [Chloroflexi bacterium]|nr:hypothetical protein [Chloroflexota bacterium]MDL1944664.1 hypothetical protein [Chloroflexi bacterium CFX2]
MASYFSDEEKLVVFDLGGTASLTLWQIKPSGQLVIGGASGTFPIFLAEDVWSMYEQMKAMLIHVEDVQEGGGVLSFGFFDPDGNRMEVCQMLE